MSNRVFAFVQLDDKNRECLERAVKKLVCLDVAGDVHVFTGSAAGTDIGDSRVQVHQVPDEAAESEPKLRNYVSKHFKDSGFSGFLHVVSDTVELLDGLPKYADEIEHVMDVLDYSVHLATVTDPCNYIYNRYSPRVAVHLD